MGDSFGKYKLRELLARGGMAEVHLAVEKTVHKGDRLVVLRPCLLRYPKPASIHTVETCDRRGYCGGKELCALAAAED